MTREQEIVMLCLEHDITFEQYLFLYMLTKSEDTNLEKYCRKYGGPDSKRLILDPLEQKGYLTNTNTVQPPYFFYKMQPTKKFLTEFGITKLNLNVSSWIKEWLDLWPKGIKSGGFYVKTGLGGCEKKMLAFVKENPQFTKDIIFDATRRYLTEMEGRGYDKMKLAPYFINKDNVSMLWGYCEQVLNSDEPSQVEWTIKA